MASTPKYRYPGVYYFDTEDTDIFRGRADDAQRLYTRISLSKTTVLHGESGSGKTSLIRAGLIPLLQEDKNSYLIVIIRFKGNRKKEDNQEPLSRKPDNILVRETMDRIKKKQKIFELYEQTGLPYISPQENNLWYYAKLAEKNGRTLLLIFDQFEELQSYSRRQIQYFKEHLFDLFSPDIPKSIYEEIERNAPVISEIENIKEKRSEFNDNIGFLERPLKTKALFAVREDKLGTLSLLGDYFGDILQNDYLLLPLTKPNARKAISEPALIDGAFLSEKFEFEPDAVEFLVQNLAEADTERVDPIQIQIVCRDIERRIAPDKRVITISDLPPISDIIEYFYRDIWNQAKEGWPLSEEEFDNNRKLMINELVVNGRRNQVHRDNLVDNDNDRRIVEKLLKEGFLREIPSGNDIYYQLTHDRLIQPLLNDLKLFEAREQAKKDQAEKERQLIEEQERAKKEQAEKERDLELARKEQENKEREFAKKLRFYVLAACTAVLGFAFLIAIYFVTQESQKKSQAQQSRILTICKTIRKSNPTLSYIIAAQEKQKFKKPNEDFVAFLAKYDSSKYAYSTGSFPLMIGVIATNTSGGNDSLNITESRSKLVWDKKNKTLIKKESLKEGRILKNFVIKNKHYLAVLLGDSIEIQSEMGIPEKKFLATDDDGRNIAVSKDGRYLLIGRRVYNYQTETLIGRLPEFEHINDHDQMISIFFNDGRHIATGYWSGYIVVSNVDEQNDTVSCVAIYSPAEGNRNIVISSLALDSKDRFMVAGNRTNTIQLWRLEPFNDSIILDSVLVKADKTEPFKILKGHSEQVNTVSLSPDDSLILSGSDDNTAILWELHTGKKLAVFSGSRNPVEYTNFSSDGKEIFTATDEILYTWSMEKPSKLYKEKELAQFSPFDYYEVGLTDMNAQAVYNITGVSTLFAATLNYLMRLPVKNQYPEDEEYLKSINTSVKEVKEMYQRLINNPHFKDSISIPNRQILLKFYNSLILHEPELLLQIEDESKLSKFNRFTKYHLQSIDMVLSDTTDVRTALVISDDFVFLGDYYCDSICDYDITLFYLKQSRDLIKAFLDKFPNITSLRENQIINYAKLSFTYLYAKQIDSALAMTDSLIRIDDGQGLANMLKIEAFLLDGKYADAEKLFKENENKRVWKTSDLSLKERLETKLKVLKERGLSTPEVEKFMEFLKKREVPEELIE